MTDKKRYSDEDLQEFKELILSKLAKAQADYDLLKAQIVNINDTNDTSPTFKALEEGASTLSKEEASHLAERQLKFMNSLKAALVRIENKTYGIDRITGELIPKERLRAVPHATLGIEQKLGTKRSERNRMNTDRSSSHATSGRNSLVWLAAIIIAAVLIADQALKIWVKTHFYLGEEVKIFSWFRLMFVENNGMAFGMEIGSKLLLTVLRICLVIVLLWYIRTIGKSIV